MPEECVYLKAATGGNADNGEPVWNCDIHQTCIVKGGVEQHMSCETCPNKLLRSNEDFSKTFLDPLTILDRTSTQTHSLRNLIEGRPSFLVCGGPSAKQIDLRLLEQRGVWSLAVNNMGGMFRSSSFICADPPCKFHHGIWLDPNVMKFVPIPKLSGRRGGLRKKEGDEFSDLMSGGKRVNVRECPNVWGFSRRSWLQTDDTFFTDHDAAWGNHNSGCKRTGLPKTVMTMLLAIRILYYLGSRRIYLVGVDFEMKNDVGLYDNYAFGQARDSGAIGSNNGQYRIANEWLTALATNGTFAKFGLEIFNCYELSGLRAFPYVPFNFALNQDVLKEYPKQPFDLEGWYEKK